MRGKIEALPKWAQDEIARLERKVEHWHKKATAGPEDSDVFVVNFGAEDQPLGLARLLRFEVDNGSFYVEPGSDHLRVSLRPHPTRPSNYISVRPVLSNVVEIWPVG